MIATQQTLQKERRFKLFFFLAVLFLLILALVGIDNLLESFLIAFVFFYVLKPVVDFFERKGLSREYATLVPFFLLILGVGILAQIFFPTLVEQLKSLKSDLPRLMQTGQKLLINFEGNYLGILKKIYPFDLQSQLEPFIQKQSTEIFEHLPDYLSKILTIMLMAPFLSYFMLVDGKKFLKELLSLVPNSIFELALNLNYQISSQMGGFIRARLMQSFLVGLVIFVGLSVLKFPYALVLSVVAGILNIIPYVGPIFSLAPTVVIFATLMDPPFSLLSVLAVYGLAQLLDTALIVPFVIAKIVNLHPVTVVLSVLVGSQLMGILGMIICIPLVSILKVTTFSIYRHLTDFR